MRSLFSKHSFQFWKNNRSLLNEGHSLFSSFPPPERGLSQIYHRRHTFEPSDYVFVVSDARPPSLRKSALKNIPRFPRDRGENNGEAKKKPSFHERLSSRRNEGVSLFSLLSCSSKQRGNWKSHHCNVEWKRGTHKIDVN